MQSTRHSSRRRPAPARRRARRATAGAGPPAVPDGAAAPVATTVDAKRAGAPQDLAFYLCDCGSAFRAAVSTTVSCPGCDALQDW